MKYLKISIIALILFACSGCETTVKVLDAVEISYKNDSFGGLAIDKHSKTDQQKDSLVEESSFGINTNGSGK